MNEFFLQSNKSSLSLAEPSCEKFSMAITKLLGLLGWLSDNTLNFHQKGLGWIPTWAKQDQSSGVFQMATLVERVATSVI